MSETVDSRSVISDVFPFLSRSDPSARKTVEIQATEAVEHASGSGPRWSVMGRV